LFASTRQGRKRTAQKTVAVGPARPDPKARHVTAEMCRAILQRPNLNDEEAGALLDRLYLVANVAVDAFIEQRGRTEKNNQCDSLAELGNESFTSVIHTV
jgi:hypothetical protein